MKKNITKEIFLSFLTSKDDNMIILMCSILDSSLQNPLISNEAIAIG